ncbi:hypothetical protein ABN034_30075 [Actinopolymorpha sp. B11F2]|uniref:hypothetical protein n=1 Tax=Actinopolymorpha sp. B11F2 TaxID=3160862 RepID=UPI0032E45D77
MRTLEQISDEYAAWLETCEAYDADPDGWHAERRREAEAAVRRERGQDWTHARRSAAARIFR